MTDLREALVAHLMEHSIRTGEFTLKSGRTSTWFCDAKQTACRPDGILLVAEAALEAIAALEVDGDPITAIGGLTAFRQEPRIQVGYWIGDSGDREIATVIRSPPSGA